VIVLLAALPTFHFKVDSSWIGVRMAHVILTSGALWGCRSPGHSLHSNDDSESENWWLSLVERDELDAVAGKAKSTTTRRL
jgi:hypothetical protein